MPIDNVEKIFHIYKGNLPEKSGRLLVYTVETPGVV